MTGIAAIPGTTTSTVQLVCDLRVAAPREVLWQAITKPALISEWFTDCRRDGADRYLLTFHDAEQPYTKQAQVLSCVTGRYATFRMRDPGYPDSTVSLTLRALSPALTMLRLTHTDPPASLLHGYRTGWPGYLDQIAPLLRRPARARP